MTIKKFIKPTVLAICVAVMAYVLLTMTNSRDPLDYSKHLDDVAFWVDDNPVTFKDLAVYILFEERKIEEQARIYNKDYTKDYWNLHTDGKFIQTEAKDVVFGMAVHDELFYQMAVAEGMDELYEFDRDNLEYGTNDFWEDMLDVQWEHLPCDEETINQQIKKTAIAEKYQRQLAEELGPSEAAYKYDGYYYQQMLKEHKVKVNKKLWDRFVMGNNTLEHKKLNYINGLTDEDKEKDKE